MRTALLGLGLTTLLTACEAAKPAPEAAKPAGAAAGAACKAASECAAGLQCIADKCVDLSTIDIGAEVQAQKSSAEIAMARITLVKLEGAAAMFKLDKADACPKTAAELRAADLIEDRDVKDPWGSDYVLVCPGTHNAVDVSSHGPDKQPGTADDLHSWQDP